MLYSVALRAQISSYCRSCVDVEAHVYKTGKVVSLLDKATMGANGLYWEALKVDFALETLDKKHLYVGRMCMWSRLRRDREVDECKQILRNN